MKKHFIVADFDDTIFSREKQLNNEELLRNNRGDIGANIVKNIIGFDYMIKKYYKNNIYPKKIINDIIKNNGIILTAGMKNYQLLKQKATNLENIEFIVVEKAEQKIERLIKYFKENNIKTDLIKIYEDRPNYFIENKDYLEKELNAKIEIYLVEMDGNRGYKKIELVK